MSTQPLVGYGGYTPEEMQVIVRRAHAERGKVLREMFAGLLAWRRKAADRAWLRVPKTLPATDTVEPKLAPESPKGGCRDIQHAISRPVHLSGQLARAWQLLKRGDAYWRRRAKRKQMDGSFARMTAPDGYRGQERDRVRHLRQAEEPLRYERD
jgi:hypothetical protein